MKLLSTIFILLLAASCSKSEPKVSMQEETPEKSPFPSLLECGAENVQGDQFITSDASILIDNAATQSNEYSRNGAHSVKLDSTNEYGFGLNILDPKVGEFIQFSVWQKLGTPHGALFVSSHGKGVTQENRTHYSSINKIENGWVMHNVSLLITADVERVELVVFSGGRTAYFDDLKIERFDGVPENQLENRISINLPIKSRQKIENFITEAKKGKVIKSEFKKYVKGYLNDGQNESKIKLKLKGDWTDHLSSGKVSCRIKIKNGAYKGLKTFSIQHPKTRNYLDEWVVHKIAEKEDVLTTTFDFVNVEINNLNHGVYALEEHFDKQLLESRNRREGPILKLDESGIWALTYARMQKGYFGEFPFYEQSQIKAFKQNRTLSNKKLRDDFYEGSRLLQLFKDGEIDPALIFDLNQLAKYQVILDMCSGVHASAWHNRRFYFNPVTQKLEHILYDLMPFGYDGNPVFLYESVLAGQQHRIQDLLDVSIIKSEAYRKIYFENFDRMTKVDYLDEIFNEYADELRVFEEAVQNEEPSYLFVKERFYSNAAHLRSNAAAFKLLWQKSSVKLNQADLLIENDYTARNDSMFFEDIALNAYLGDSTSIGYEVHLENYHLNEIEVCGYESNHWPGHVYEIDQKIKLTGFNDKGNSADYLALYKPRRLFFKSSNLKDRYYETEVLTWKKPEGETSRMQLSKDQSWKKYCTYNSGRAKFSGDVVIDDLLYFPLGMTVEVSAGSKLQFVGEGGLIVNGDFIALGSESSPIQFLGDSSANNGITILNAQKVEMKNVIADKMSNLQHERWQLTGAITIYESNTQIENLKILDAQCEDALNIIRSEFTISQLQIEGCKSDGFDADFCNGVLKSSIFKNTGNDCIDFSGSRVEIDEVYIKNSGDKGISGGEKSVLNLNNITIDGAVTGIASKDQSEVYGENVSIKKVDYSLMVFQKKDEYGPAQLQLEKSQVFDGREVIDLGSTLTLNGLMKKGVEKIDVDALYERFE